MKQWRSIAVSAALVAVVAGGGWYVWQSKQDPAGLATGRSNVKATQLWSKLSDYKESYLRRYFIAYQKDSPTALDALTAFNELAYQITGPGGFWRKEVPFKWLGCKAQPESASCGAVEVMGEELARWDTLQEKIAETDEARAQKFLDENAADLLDYLETMVPAEASSTGMQKTALFEKHLKSAMQQDGLL
jgi:hypothetical protein